MRRSIFFSARGVVFLLVFTGGASATHSIADRVQDCPAAAIIRESLIDFEKGEASENDAVKIEWYSRGKALAEAALRTDDRNADAHFAYFANWGRILQTDGWLKNAYHLPELQRELDRVLELNPDHSDALAAKGGLYLHLPSFLGGDIDKAEPLLQRALEIDPNAAGSLLELGECTFRKSRPEDARGLLVLALRLAREQGKERYIRRAENLLADVDEALLQSNRSTAAAAAPRPRPRPPVGRR